MGLGDSFVNYAIPKKDQNYTTNREEYAWKIVSKLIDKPQIGTNAKLIDGCNIIKFNNKFVSLLHEGYLSFILGLHHSAVSLCSVATERLCYDLIEYSQIEFNEKILDYNEKKFFFTMPFNKIVDFLLDVGVITKGIKDDMMRINDLRNRYVHPTFESENPGQDAKTSLNLLCKVIDSIISIKS
jgi:hypothetical protein